MIHVPIQLCSTTGVCPELVTINSTSEILVWEASLDLARISPLTSTDDTTKSSEFAISISNDTSTPEILEAENLTPATDERPTETLFMSRLSANTSPELASITVPT